MAADKKTSASDQVEDAVIEEVASTGTASASQTRAAAADPAPSSASTGANAGGGIGLLSLGVAILALVLGAVSLVMVFTRPSADVAEVARLSVQLDGLERGLENVDRDLAEGPSAGQVRDQLAMRLDGLQSQFDEIKSSIKDASANVASAPVADTSVGALADSTLSPRLVAVEQSIATLASAGVVTPAQLALLQGNVAENARQLEALAVQLGAETSAMSDQLESALTDQDQAAADQSAQVQSLVDALTARVDEIAAATATLAADLQAQSEKNAASSARLLAVSRLRDALELGRGVESEVRAVEVVSSTDAQLAQVVDQLKPIIVQEVPTLDSLQASFPVLWQEIKLADQVANAGGNQLGQMMARVRNLVSIQRGGTEQQVQDLEGLDGDLARVNFYLQREDLTMALRWLDELGGESADRGAEFTSSLEARAAYIGVVTQLDQWLVARLAADSLASDS